MVSTIETATGIIESTEMAATITMATITTMYQQQKQQQHKQQTQIFNNKYGNHNTCKIVDDSSLISLKIRNLYGYSDSLSILVKDFTNVYIINLQGSIDPITSKTI
ncbi:hypothetical protein ACTA71_009160 [Dictyostelium dimigraforme]